MENKLRNKIKKIVISFSILLSAAMVIYSSCYLITTSTHVRYYPVFIAYFVAGVLAIFIGCAMYFCND